MWLKSIWRFLNRYSPVTIHTPWVGVVGNCSEEIYYALLRARRENKKALLLFPRDLFWIFYFSKKRLGINRELIRIESPYRFGSHGSISNGIGRFILMTVYCTLRLANLFSKKFLNKSIKSERLTPRIGYPSLWGAENAAEFSSSAVKAFDWKEQLQSYLPVDLPARSRQKAERLRQEMGLPLSEWFVCIHVREGGFYGFQEGLFKCSRNSSIKKCIKAIQYITNSGGWVVRMGDATMTPLPHMERVIDYPHTPFKSDLMDMYLIKECRFYIGAQSGIWSTASLFQKPVLTINMNDWIDSFPERPGDLGIIKHIYSRSRKRFLSVKESIQFFTKHYFRYDYGNEYELYENTSDEIYELVKEFMEKRTNTPHSHLQKICNEHRVAAGYGLLEEQTGLHDHRKNVILKYHLAARLEGCAGALGNTFLERYWAECALEKVPEDEEPVFHDREVTADACNVNDSAK
jgi:putative glycosyltransferase (TIGR04372 family)